MLRNLAADLVPRTSPAASGVDLKLLLATRRVVRAVRGGLAVTSGSDPSRACMALTLHSAVDLVKDHGLDAAHTRT